MMKTPLLIAALALGAGSSAWAGACVSGDNLAQYISAGSCTFDNLTFTFNSTSYVPSGSVIIPASSVTVNTDTVGGEEGLLFNAPWFAGATTTLDADISYTVSCNTCQIDDWSLSIGGIALPPSPTDAFVDVGETSPGVPSADWLAVGANSIGSSLTDTTTFPPQISLTVDKDLTVYGGSTPSFITTKVSSMSNLFSTTGMSTVPEPSLAILCVGLLGLLPLARRRFMR